MDTIGIIGRHWMVDVTALLDVWVVARDPIRVTYYYSPVRVYSTANSCLVCSN